MKKLISAFLLALCILMRAWGACPMGISLLPSNIKPGDENRLSIYRENVLRQKVPCSPSVLSNLWKQTNNDTSAYNCPQMALVVTEEMKTKHSSRMKSILDRVPWRSSISDREFERYILPYRAADEMIDFAGDSLLQVEYEPLINGIADPIEAFRIICKKVYDTIRECKSSCPYTLDAFAINYIRQANCEQRCVLSIHILRQLGIPCCIDKVPFWGNYSTVGHSWVAMPYQGNLYIFEDTSKGGVIHEASLGFIDAALFPIKYEPTIDDKYPYPLQNRKEVTKVYRLAEGEYSMGKDSLFAYSGYEDVSRSYGLKKQIKKRVLKAEVSGDHCYLCSFRTGYNWEPIACAMIDENGYASFKDINPEVTYILACNQNGKIKPLTNPFIGAFPDQEFVANKAKEERATLCRKYPIFSHWTNQWGNMIGSTIEVCNDLYVEYWDTIATVNNMPFGMTSIPSMKTNKKYRYIRYHANQNTRTPLAELEIFSNQKKLSGNPISYGILPGKDNSPFDGDFMTVCSTKQPGYWVGLDLGEACTIDSIRFLPKNDGNDIQLGHRYELYYFDMGWKSLGSKVAISNHLKYYVPQGALLLLKDKTKGVEERPFLYESRKSVQLWH